MNHEFEYEEYETLLKSLDILEDRINILIDEYELIINNPISLKLESIEGFGVSKEEAEEKIVVKANENKKTQLSYKEYITLLKAKVIRLKDRFQVQNLIDFKGDEDA